MFTNINKLDFLFNNSLNFDELNKAGSILLGLFKKTNEQLLLVGKNKRPFKLDIKFIEWLVGFTDAEGNFHLSLKDLKNNTFRLPQLTFQIGLHIDDLKTLKLIQSKLHCGLITISKDRCNFYVNDIFSIVNIIIPIFTYFKLNSSKIHMFNIFKIAAELVFNGGHLNQIGKMKLISLRYEIGELVKNKKPGKINKITLQWLVGFIEGECSFSTSINCVRFKFENTIVEANLFKAILEFLGLSHSINLQFPKLRNRSLNENPVVVFEITPIDFIYKQLIPLLQSANWYTKKYLDFKDWSIIARLQYLGFHRLVEGQNLISLIKSRMNNFRLSTNLKFKGNLFIPQLVFNKVFSLPNPYLDYGTFRIKANTLNIVQQNGFSLVVTNLNSNHKKIYSKLSDCINELKINKIQIITCLTNKTSYQGYTFSIESTFCLHASAPQRSECLDTINV